MGNKQTATVTISPRGAKRKPPTADEVAEAKRLQLRQEELITELSDIFRTNPLAWGKFTFPHHFRLQSPMFHHIMMEQAKVQQYLAIAAPRGSSKTTIVGFNYPAHRICYKLKRFIVYISNTFKQATMMLQTIKNEVKENQAVRKQFGIKVVKDAEDVTIFRHPDGFEVMVICLGADQMGNIRGRKFGAYRPDLVILDDVENDELVRSAERRLKLQEDFDNAVLPAGDVDTQFFAIGTILHDDSLMAKLLSKTQYTDFKKVFFQGLYTSKSTGEQYSIWPEKMPVEWLINYRKEKPHTFAREIQNNPSATGTEEIDKRDFRYWTIENNEAILFGNEGNIRSRFNLADCKAGIGCDLAWEDKQESDYSVIFPAFLTPQSDILFDDYVCRKGLRPNEFEEILFSMEARLKSITKSIVPIGFEKAKLEKVMKWFLKQAMRQRNRFLLLKDIRWSTEKIERIVTRLQPRYAQHTIYHKRGMGDLETQLVRIRSTAHDDIADAAQIVVQLLEYPKNTKRKSVAPEDETFMKLRQTVVNKFKSRRNIGKFRVGRKPVPIKSKICPI